MPHLIIEHSGNVKRKSIAALEHKIQNIMQAQEGNFDADQCKCRSLSFDEYLVGRPDQTEASFIHITLKVLTGRSVEIRANLSQKIIEFVQKFYNDLNLPTKRCDISVDIVEMERDTYQKIRIE
jgi:5-carboxymethyl-2-hydroxymuconate isomerase